MSMYLKMSVSNGYQDFESDNYILLSIINFKGFTAPIILVPRMFYIMGHRSYTYADTVWETKEIMSLIHTA